jgi:hypothetical protein
MGLRRQRPRLALEPGHALRVIRHCPGEDLDGDIPPQSFVTRAVHFAHAAGTERLSDAIGAEPPSDHGLSLEFLPLALDAPHQLLEPRIRMESAIGPGRSKPRPPRLSQNMESRRDAEIIAGGEPRSGAAPGHDKHG